MGDGTYEPVEILLVRCRAMSNEQPPPDRCSKAGTA
jgi:hypothetical protein